MTAALLLIVVASVTVIAWGPVSRRLRRPASELQDLPPQSSSFAELPIVHDRETPIARASESIPSTAGAPARRERPVSSGDSTR